MKFASARSNPHTNDRQNNDTLDSFEQDDEEDTGFAASTGNRAPLRSNNQEEEEDEDEDAEVAPRAKQEVKDAFGSPGKADKQRGNGGESSEEEEGEEEDPPSEAHEDTGEADEEQEYEDEDFDDASSTGSGTPSNSLPKNKAGVTAFANKPTQQSVANTARDYDDEFEEEEEVEDEIESIAEEEEMSVGADVRIFYA
jgi:hypothetical protein